MNEDIHASADANTTGYTYTQVYASVAASPTINGVVVPIKKVLNNASVCFQ